MQKITLNTKAIDLLETYPWLKDEIKKMGDAFKIIDSPLAKLFLKNATIGDIVKQFNLDPDETLQTIASLIKKHINQ